MFLRTRIHTHERGFLHQGQEYVRALSPGVHWAWGFGLRVVRASTRQVVFQSPDLELYLRDPQVWTDLVVIDLRQHERALVWVDGRLQAVHGPSEQGGRFAYWKDLHEVIVEVHPVHEVRLVHPRLEAVLATQAGQRELLEVVVPAGHRGLLFVDERLHEELGPGRYAVWRAAGRVNAQVLDLREVTLDVAGQEILTKDKVSLRLNLVAVYRVTDPRGAAEATGNLQGAIYRDLQLALREAVGGRSLDDLLAAKEQVGREVHAAVEARARALGVALGHVGVRDVILPGEMKTLLNQVIEAEKRAQAALIQRREETAATRALLNTARLVEQSPTLLRLKELETAERIAASVDSLQLVGNDLESVLRRMIPAPRGDAASA